MREAEASTLMKGSAESPPSPPCARESPGQVWGRSDASEQQQKNAQFKLKQVEELNILIVM